MFYHASVIAVSTCIEFIPKGAQYGGSSETKVLYLQQVFFVNASQSYDFLVDNARFGGGTEFFGSVCRVIIQLGYTIEYRTQKYIIATRFVLFNFV